MNAIYTTFTCDRCGLDNAIRLSLKVKENKRQEVDLCYNCQQHFSAQLFKLLKMDVREEWIQAFTKNILK